MKIQGSSSRSHALGAASGVSPNLGGPLAAPAASVATDQIQLSNLAQLAGASSDSPSNVNRLLSLSATVSSGQYYVEAGLLSNNIIDASTHIRNAA